VNKIKEYAERGYDPLRNILLIIYILVIIMINALKYSILIIEDNLIFLYILTFI